MIRFIQIHVQIFIWVYQIKQNDMFQIQNLRKFQFKFNKHNNQSSTYYLLLKQYLKQGGMQIQVIEQIQNIKNSQQSLVRAQNRLIEQQNKESQNRKNVQNKVNYERSIDRKKQWNDQRWNEQIGEQILGYSLTNKNNMIGKEYINLRGQENRKCKLKKIKKRIGKKPKVELQQRIKQKYFFSPINYFIKKNSIYN